MNGPRGESVTEQAFGHITAARRRIEPWSSKTSAFIVVLVILTIGWQLTASYLSKRRAELAAGARAKQEEVLRHNLDVERQKQVEDQAKANEAKEKALPENVKRNAELLQQTQKDEATLNEVVSLERQLAVVRERQQDFQQLLSNEQALKAKHDKMGDMFAGLAKDEEKRQKLLQSDEAAKEQFEGNDATGAIIKKEDTLMRQIDTDQAALNALTSQKTETAEQISNIEAEQKRVADDKEKSAATLPLNPTVGTAPDNVNNQTMDRGYEKRRSDLSAEVTKESRELSEAERPFQPNRPQDNPAATNLQNGGVTPQPAGTPNSEQIDPASAFAFIQQHLRYLQDAQFYPNNVPNAAFQTMMSDYAPVVFFHEKGLVSSDVIRTDRVGYVNTFKRRSIRNVLAVSQQRLQSANPGVSDVIQIVFQWEERIGDGQFHRYLDTWDIAKMNGRFVIISERSANDKR